MSTGTDLGFDIDEETVELFDAILVNIATDKELKGEFKKLRFIKTLQNNYNKSKGPIRQLMEKMGKIEETYASIQMDNRRLVSDMDTLVSTIKEFAGTANPEHKDRALKKLQGINLRNLRNATYSWNNKNGI